MYNLLYSSVHPLPAEGRSDVEVIHNSRNGVSHPKSGNVDDMIKLSADDMLERCSVSVALQRLIDKYAPELKPKFL